MSWWRLLVPALVLAAALALLLSFGTAEGTYRIYVPRGYINEVNRLIDEGRLVYDCRSERIRPRKLSPEEQYFHDNSYLRRDLAAWNQDGDRRPFLVEREERRGGGCEGRVAAVNGSYHKQRLPTYVADTWRGSLFLRHSTARTTLTSAERTIEVVTAPWELLPLPALAFEDVWFGDRTRGIRSQRLAFKMFERGRPFATLKNIGDQAVLEVTGDRPRVALDGCPLPLGWRVRLDGGDTLRIQHSERIDDRYTVETGRRASLVSFVSRVNGEPRRKTYTDRLAMARDVTWAIDAAVIESQEIAGAPGRDDFDVTLTLDPFLSDGLERQLGAFCRQRYGRRPLRAAVTVLEPASGRILALASYPTAAEVEDLEVRSTARRELLLLNHNFLHHPVGSATKPFLAAAALATQPALATLRIPCFAGGEPPRSLLGYDLGTYNLPPDCHGAGGDGRIDFRGFLTVSSNRYMLYLGLLALADWDAAGPAAGRSAPPLSGLDRYRLGGRSFTARPRLSIVKEESGGGLTELAEVADQDFMRWFRDLFGHRVAYRRGPAVEGLDLRSWQPVIDATLGDRRHPATMSFSPVTPEQVNLRANLIQQLRQDLYTLLLGAGNNRWSNLQLAEALSRLVAERPVEARLIERVVVPGGRRTGDSEAGNPEGEDEVLWDLETRLAAAEADWQLAENHRRLLLDAMASVIDSPHGTAHKLASPLAAINRQAPPGVTYRLLGKTGTPTSALETVRRSPTAPGPGAIRVFSGNRQVKSGILVLAIRRTEGTESSDLALTFYIEGQGGSEQTVDLAVSMLRQLVESTWPEDWLESPSG